MKSTVQYKCPDCGGDIHYDPKMRMFACDWCHSYFTKEQLVGDEDFAEDDNDTPNYADELDVYVCASCGAEIVCDHNTSATFCCYCHSPVALKGRLSGNYRPEYIIPFKIDKDMAIAALREEFKKEFFASKTFLSDATLETMKGLYVPFWMADCDVHSMIEGTGSKPSPYNDFVAMNYGVGGSHGSYGDDNSFQYKFVRHADIHFSKVSIVASKQINDELINSIEPYSYSELKDFSMSYLSGFYAEKFDLSPGRINGKLHTKLRSGAEATIERVSMTAYQNINVRNNLLTIKSCDWHFVLLPVWFMSYKFGRDTYFYAVNGQTGKAYGKYPLSILKVLLSGVAVGLLSAFFPIASLIVSTSASTSLAKKK